MDELAPLDRDGVINTIRERLMEPRTEATSEEGTLLFSGGHPPDVLIALSGSTIQIAIYDPDAGTSSPPADDQTIVSLNWQRLPAPHLVMSLNVALGSARELRFATFQHCKRCDALTAPEMLNEHVICETCNNRDLGVVY